MLQALYRVELREAFGIEFSNLLCLNNMPIKRYVDYLQRHGQLQEYMEARPPYHCLLDVIVVSNYMRSTAGRPHRVVMIVSMSPDCFVASVADCGEEVLTYQDGKPAKTSMVPCLRAHVDVHVRAWPPAAPTVSSYGSADPSGAIACSCW